MGAGENQIYFSTKAVSSSFLKKFVKDSPAVAKNYYDGFFHQEPTAAMKKGSMVHTAILEPHLFNERYIPLSVDLRTKEGKAEKSRILADYPEGSAPEIVSVADYDHASRMAQVVLSDTECNDLLFRPDAVKETPIYWTDTPTGLDCKCMPDCYTPSLNVIVDVKTTTSSARFQFAREIQNYLYNLQAGFYTYPENFLKSGTDFVFIAVEKEPPFEIGIFRMSRRYLAVSQSLIEGSLFEVVRCFENGIWPTRHAAQGVIELDCPPWMINKEKNEFPTYREENSENDFNLEVF